MNQIENFKIKSFETSTAENLLSKTKITLGSLRGVQNVYTQHIPPLMTIISQVFKGKLKETNFPFLESNNFSSTSELIVFFVNGVSYEEAKMCHEYNVSHPGTKVILGGSDIINFQKYFFYNFYLG